MVVTPGDGLESGMEHEPHNRFSESGSPWVGLQQLPHVLLFEQPGLKKNKTKTLGHSWGQTGGMVRGQTYRGRARALRHCSAVCT